MQRFQAVALASSVVVLTNLTPALAAGYHCKLPLLMSDQVLHGKREGGTTSDPTIDFQVRLTAVGDRALIEGTWYELVRQGDMKTFVSVAAGTLTGVDILTVYEGVPEGGGFYAAESRHIGAGSSAMVELMVGACNPT